LFHSNLLTSTEDLAIQHRQKMFRKDAVFRKSQKQLPAQAAKVGIVFLFFAVAIFIFIGSSQQNLSYKYKPVQGSFSRPAVNPSDSWTPLPPPPVGFQEGSAIVIGQNIWWFGGFPIDKGYVSIYDLDTQQWRLGPFFPWGLHHLFNAAFVTKTHLVVLGGIIHEDGKHRRNDAALMRRIGDETSPWQIKKLPVGGMISCTQFDVGGKRWCYTGDQQNFVEAPFRFFEIEVETLEIKQLSIPPINSTHVALLHDADRGVIYLATGRKKVDEDTDLLTKMFMFDLEKSEWLPKPLEIPYSDLEGRAALQLPGSDVALLLGGEAGALRGIVSDVVLQFHFDSRKFVWVEELPLQMFGFPTVLLPNGKVMLAGGAAGVGPKFMRMAWEWDPQDLLTTKQYRPSYKGEGLQVTYAHCGTIVVTRELQHKVAGGNTTIPAEWCHEEEATGPGSVVLPNVLTIYFLRDGKTHSITCDGNNSCKLGP
jgi:hypothetical protein